MRVLLDILIALLMYAAYMLVSIFLILGIALGVVIWFTYDDLNMVWKILISFGGLLCIGGYILFLRKFGIEPLFTFFPY